VDDVFNYRVDEKFSVRFSGFFFQIRDSHELSDIGRSDASVEESDKKDFEGLKETDTDVLFFLNELPGIVAEEDSGESEGKGKQDDRRSYGEYCFLDFRDIQGVNEVEED
jgi:hypothetical protein